MWGTWKDEDMTSLGYVTKVSKPLMANLIARVLVAICKHIEFRSLKAWVAHNEDAYSRRLR